MAGDPSYIAIREELMEKMKSFFQASGEYKNRLIFN